ncbi:uncharacterized protein LOC117643861 [Thrips palmi]|uniref:Uncharacterized protein LOC117643861 n=1 Tax=Thrips palmi TaxID=161013 RepID=A0A6P8YXE3_THRPL|nr:uncharacterized protein LOC117643861 [Thrips palmi]
MSAYYGATPVQKIGHKQQMWQKLENFTYDPALLEMEPLTFFNNRKSVAPVNMYDCRFNQPDGWDQRKPRCDRRLVSHVHPEIYNEEERKVVPVTWSLWHGRPSLGQLDVPGKEHARRPQIVTFYRRFGLNLQMEMEQKPA